MDDNIIDLLIWPYKQKIYIFIAFFAYEWPKRPVEGIVGGVWHASVGPNKRFFSYYVGPTYKRMHHPVLSSGYQ